MTKKGSSQSVLSSFDVFKAIYTPENNSDVVIAHKGIRYYFVQTVQ